VKALVVGCGSIGLRHIRNLQALSVDQILITDPQAARLVQLQHETGAQAFPTYDEALAGRPDIVLICSPTDHHVSQALKAARSGCDLFIEKPLSQSADGVDDLMAEADRRQLVTMIGCNMRFHPGPQVVKQLLDEGAVGRVISARIHTGSFLPRWRPQTDYHESYSASRSCGGAVLDCIHEIDLALWYFGPASLVAALTVPATSLAIDVDGLAEALLRHHAGSVTSVHLNFVQRDYQRSCHVIGTEGTIHWDFGQASVRLHDGSGAIARTVLQPEPWTLNDMYLDELRHFLRASAERRQTMNPVSRGLETLTLALEIRHPMASCAASVGSA